MAAMAKALPSYAWLTALPQLISRICHANPEVNTVTNHIITHVAEAYPQQVSSPCLLSALCSVLFLRHDAADANCISALQDGSNQGDIHFPSTQELQVKRLQIQALPLRTPV